MYLNTTICNKYNTASNKYNTDSNKYNTDSNSYNTGSNKYNTDSNQYNTDSNKYNTDSNKYNTDNLNALITYQQKTRLHTIPNYQFTQSLTTMLSVSSNSASSGFLELFLSRVSQYLASSSGDLVDDLAN